MSRPADHAGRAASVAAGRRARVAMERRRIDVAPCLEHGSHVNRQMHPATECPTATINQE
ncbi:hypothetical protein [Aeromicrobium sp. Leaf291]|uniref:hypothetical protein n=1 Tax=Aeromicrobium sp. Leaf291 TaxID=1736325 RepID=UPI000A994331|nr:hypothetical protein [Aeromicrobium sp. Leaf291]